MGLAYWTEGQFTGLTDELFDDLRKTGKEKLSYLLNQYFSIGKSYRGKIIDLDIDLTSESKRCDVYIVMIITYINKKEKECTLRYRLNDWHSIYDKFYYAPDEDSLKLFIEMKDED